MVDQARVRRFWALTALMLAALLAFAPSALAYEEREEGDEAQDSIETVIRNLDDKDAPREQLLQVNEQVKTPVEQVMEQEKIDGQIRE